MNELKEEYVHLCSSIDNLNYSWKVLKSVREEKGRNNPLLLPAFQFALIEYAKPYGKSRGVIKRHKLDTRFIPEKYKSLHERLLSARNQIHAHSDLTLKDADVYTYELEGNVQAGIVQSRIDLSAELGNIEQIIDMIESVLENMYMEQASMGARLQ
ncbi:hypothetical protein ACWOVX_004334 [Vibrio vulnificus]|uniref:hypothetical protein n=1 Tax=Vibrio vulnificus TaxID=672 RepID=UPI001CDD74E9|nr:hypothetical protein [Vibrio vulnificus]EGR0072995.1 hypothetical protein [Vibrio vulnificus]EGR0753562.1 hypothetical protein [Vibrio vulnificus]EJE8536128.1 hypothetical protein [Vibrio vulnificus]MCA3895417.1 hypothetical protein [Vibrio vulnificus]MCA3958316.1 hypothetical protein [Vibrio vulnificus]